jgi:hypothetical protein
MSESLKDFRLALRHADRLIEGTKSTAGKPTAQEGTMFVASVALTYAAWEAYVEDLAVEATQHLSESIDAADVPESSRQAIESRKSNPWDLFVHPGWRAIWRDAVLVKAKGEQSKDPKSRDEFGMNTAREKQIRTLFRAVGIDFMDKVSADDRAALEDLVTARGEVVHAASAPAAFKKSKAKAYRDLVERMALVADEELRQQITALTGKEPWSVAVAAS